MTEAAAGKTAMALSSRAYRLFGHVIVVESDSPAVLATLDAIYPRHRLALSGPDLPADLRMRVLAAPTGPLEGDTAATAGSTSLPHGAARIEVAGRTIRVPSPDQLVHYAHLVLVNAAAALVEDSIVLHSGAIVRDGLAMLLVGHSGRGKTTLCLELVRRGWGFLSDDFAALTRYGVVEPFPRCLNLTAETARMMGFAPRPDALTLPTCAGSRKWMVDIEELFPHALCTATPLGIVALLGQPTATSSATRSGTTMWRLELDHLPRGFETELASLPGVRGVVPRVSSDATVVEVVTMPGARIVSALDELCVRFDVAVLASRRVVGAAGGRSRPPRHRAGRPKVTPLSADVAVPELLAHALSLSGARFLGRPAAAELAGAHALLGRALRNCATIARIEAGALAPTADALERLAPIREET